jgi:chemotaxis protein methyltransferase CheR
MSNAELSQVDFQRFQDYIYSTAGIKIGDHKRTLVSNRIRRRLNATGKEDFSDYYKFLVSPAGREELPQFLNEITTNETYFLRDPHQYEWLRRDFCKMVSDPILSARRPKTIDIWSAASSTGEEPYSIALSLAQGLSNTREWKIRVVGTDLSNAVISKAKEAVYRERALQLVSEADRKKYFEFIDSDPPAWRVRQELRSLVQFKNHNLLNKLGAGPFDIIFIKNVLIYFDDASKKVVVDHLLRELRPGGYMVVGPAEGIFRMLGDLERLSPWLYRKTAKG